MSKYIDSEKLIERLEEMKQAEYENCGGVNSKTGALQEVQELIDSLQQEPRFPQYDNIVEKIFGAGNLDGWERDEAEMLVALAKEELLKSLKQEQSDIKSPFTGGKVTILSREEEITFRGEKVKITRKYYRCVDTGREFTDSKLDDDMMWAAFRAYCEKKGMTSFTDIMLKQEQPDNEDIDKVAQELYEHLYELKRRNNVPTNLYDKQEIIDLWKAGIEYGRNHPKQEQPECIYGRTPEEREKCCKFCSAICEARIEQEQLEVDATTLRREAIGKAMEVYPPSINEDADGMPYDEHTDLQQGFITGYELGFNARKEE